MKNLIVILFTVLAGCLVSEAQNSTSSPYSLYGVGVLNQLEDASEMGMGHAGVALAPSDHVNTSTPAGIANLDSATFYFNFQMKLFHARESNEHDHQSVYSANIDGITMGFRKRWWAGAIGYAPYSTVGYDMSDEQQYIAGTTTKYRIRYTGSGGLQRAFINNAFTILDHVTLAASVGALWGSITKRETAMFSEAIYGENVYNTKKYTMNNFFFEFGAQFHFNIGQYNNFRFGGKFNNKTKLLSSYDHIVSNDVSSQLFFDDVTPLKDEFHVPLSYAVGMAYTRKRFMATIDYHNEKWGDVVNSKFRETARFVDCWSLGGGAQWSFGNPTDPFYKRMKLRLGGYFSTSYLGLGSKEVVGMKEVTYNGWHYNYETRDYEEGEYTMRIPVLDDTNKKLNVYSFTAGLTVPLGRFSNSLIIGYEYLKRGTEEGGLVLEKYHNFKVAFNIRETWFLKSKIE